MCASAASDRVLNTAADLFYRRGIRAVGVDAVIAGSGVAKMTLYKHFTSKDSLIVAALEQQDRQFREWFEVALGELDPAPEAKLLGLFDVIGGFIASEEFRGCAFINAAVELCDPEHPAMRVAKAHKEWLRGRIRELVCEAGLAEPECTAEALFLLVEGAIVGAQVGVAQNPAATAKCTATMLLQCRRPPADRTAGTHEHR